MNFRHEARLALQRAKAELESADDKRIRYASLELRMAMEALTYDRSQAFKAEIPPKEYETWQPRKVMQMLLEIDPNVDKGSSVSFGREEEYGVPAKHMMMLGTEDVLDLAILKKHYDALGAYLHMPTLKQIEQGQSFDSQKLRARCEKIVAVIEKVLASRVFNITLGAFTELSCQRCGATIRKRISHGFKEIEAKCFECGAQYIITDTDSGKTLWKAMQEQIPCPTDSCDAKVSVWLDEIKPGTWWTCHQCGEAYEISLAVSKHERDPNESS
jgi:hypothetical protein